MLLQVGITNDLRVQPIHYSEINEDSMLILFGWSHYRCYSCFPDVTCLGVTDYATAIY